MASLNSNNGLYHLELTSVGSGIMDQAKNPLASLNTPDAYWKIDKTAPQIVSLTRVDPAVINLDQVSWHMTFSEGVYGLSPSNFQLTGDAAPGAQIVSVVGTDIFVNVWNNGTLTLEMVNSTGAGDSAGNPVSNVPFVGESYTIARPIMQVTSVQVNDGSIHRSKVSSLTVTFSGVPDFAGSPVAAFKLQRQSDGALVTLNPDWNGNVVTLSFTGGPLEYGSLADGRYDLTMLHSQIANFNGDNNGTAGEDHVFNFHRLFGDADGNATVTSSDFAAFRSVFGTGGISPFDFNGDFGVNADDFAQFRKRFGLSI